MRTIGQTSVGSSQGVVDAKPAEAAAQKGAAPEARPKANGGEGVAASQVDVARPAAPPARARRIDLAGSIAALEAELQPRRDIIVAQSIIQNARGQLFDKLTPAQIDAEHAEVKQQPIPDTLQGCAEVLIDRLRISGAERDAVMKAVGHILAGKQVPGVYSEHIGGKLALNPETHSTQMAVTDPGEDHLLMTLADPRMLNKAWAHVEHIDRLDKFGNFSKHTLPYALPKPMLLQLVRLFIAGDGPTTLFYGSPNYRASALGDAPPDGADDVASAALIYNREKVVRELAFLAGPAFADGVDEVKVIMDGLSPEETEGLMHDVVEEVPIVKDPDNPHFFSAAFNLNKGLVDFGLIAKDAPRISGLPTKEQRDLMLQMALRAVDATAKGGFAKVTLDSASLEPPSYPLIEFFGVQNLLKFVHAAHQKGLETYVSGGMNYFHFPLLAMTGVDGVGVGGAIHEKTDNPGKMGRMMPNGVLKALDLRDKAEASWPGQAVFVLRQMDEKQAAGELSDEDAKIQQRIFDAMLFYGEKVDGQLDALKIARDADLEALKQQKAEGKLSDGDFKAQSKKVTDAFQKSFEQLITGSIDDPEAAARAKAVALEAQAKGYLLRLPEGGAA